MNLYLRVDIRNFLQYLFSLTDRYAPCKLELRKLINRKEELHVMAVKAQDWAEHEAWVPPLPPPGWRLRGALVAHLHEHKSAVNRFVKIVFSIFVFLHLFDFYFLLKVSSHQHRLYNFTLNLNISLAEKFKF